MRDRPADSLVPVFMVGYLPEGLRGLLLAAILAAAMSSIDSALNSLAAVTLEDVFGRAAEQQSVWLGRGTSLLWGLFAVVSGLWFARASTGVLELVNQVGSAFYGPVLAVFVLGALFPRVRQREALAGLGLGLACNLALARFAPSVSWLWWNPAGFLAAVSGALALAGRPLSRAKIAFPRREALLLRACFVLILAVLLALPRG
jgi:Na+/proline symporter